MRLHDLCGDTVRFDYPTMLFAARCAVGACNEKIGEYVSSIRREPTRSLTAEWMIDEAKRLQAAVETLEALEGMKDRPKVEWRNRPIVIPEA
jgi:hypothetical protein